MGTNPQSQPTLVFLGHPKPWHGAERLVPLLEAVCRSGHEARLLVVGGGRDAAQMAGPHVEVTGEVDAAGVAAHLRRATVALAPYPRLPFFYFCPLKVIEYMAAGLPVVTTAQGDLPPLVGNAGLLVDPDDDDALARAVTSLLDDPAARARLGRSGRQRARTQLSWSAAADRIEAALARLRQGAAA